MTGQEEPILSLGEPPKRLTSNTSGVPRGWLWSLLCLQLLIIGGLIAFWLRADGTAKVTFVSGSSADELKAAAIALEERSLYTEAARTWHAYLGANPTDLQRAEILYRVGKLAIQAEDFNQAVTALVHAEQAAVDDSDLKTKIGPWIVDCLRRLGRYGDGLLDVERSLTIDPERAHVLNSRAFALVGLGRYEEALADVELSLQTLDDAWNDYVRAGALGGLERYGEGLADLEKAISFDSLFREEARESGWFDGLRNDATFGLRYETLVTDPGLPRPAPL